MMVGRIKVASHFPGGASVIHEKNDNKSIYHILINMIVLGNLINCIPYSCIPTVKFTISEFLSVFLKK